MFCDNTKHDFCYVSTSLWSELPRPGLKTKHAPSKSPVSYWCRSARVAKEQLHPNEILTHIQCSDLAGLYLKLALAGIESLNLPLLWA